MRSGVQCISCLITLHAWLPYIWAYLGCLVIMFKYRSLKCIWICERKFLYLLYLYFVNSVGLKNLQRETVKCFLLSKCFMTISIVFTLISLLLLSFVFSFFSCLLFFVSLWSCQRSSFLLSSKLSGRYVFIRWNLYFYKHLFVFMSKPLNIIDIIINVFLS